MSTTAPPPENLNDYLDRAIRKQVDQLENHMLTPAQVDLIERKIEILRSVR